jgi:hypothetical protein
MEMKPVTSSNIAAIGHDGNALHVQFKSGAGATHKYIGVPPELHEAMLTAPSVGKFFHKNIKGQYPEEKV